MARSPSGDTDILVIFLLHQFDGLRVLIDNGTGKNQKILDMSTSLSTVYQQALGCYACIFWKKLCILFLPERQENILEVNCEESCVCGCFHRIGFIQ